MNEKVSINKNLQFKGEKNMGMTKEQIEERIENIDKALSILQKRQDAFVAKNGKESEKTNERIKDLIDQRSTMKQQLDSL